MSAIPPEAAAAITDQASQPTHTYLDTIRSMKAVMDMNTAAGISNDPYTKIWEVENKFLSRAVQAIHDNETLALKFGAGMTGALALVPVLRAVHDTEAIQALLKPYAVVADDFKRVTASKTGFVSRSGT